MGDVGCMEAKVPALKRPMALSDPDERTGSTVAIQRKQNRSSDSFVSSYKTAWICLLSFADLFRCRCGSLLSFPHSSTRLTAKRSSQIEPQRCELAHAIRLRKAWRGLGFRPPPGGTLSCV